MERMSDFFGSHGDMPVKVQRQGISSEMFCHSPESRAQIWEEQIFERGEVTKVNAVLREMNMTAERLERAVPIEEGVIFCVVARSVERL